MMNSPWYFSGVSTPALIERAQDLPIGIMLQPDNHYERLRTSYRRWAVDNGCFSKPKTFNTSKWLAWVRRLSLDPAGCQFVVAPDVPFDARATLMRSRPIFPMIRAMGLPVALAAQNGLEDMVIPWDEFDCLFMAGDTSWKLSIRTALLMAEARERGKYVHTGRVNSRKRFRRVWEMGAQSCDGTFLRFGPDKNLPKLLYWLGEPAPPPLVPPSSMSRQKQQLLKEVPLWIPKQGTLFRPRPIVPVYYGLA